MKNTILLFFFGAFFLIAFAKETKQVLNNQEIQKLLSGNTAFYLQDGAKQFFQEGGHTDYIDRNGSPSTGKWWVAGGKFCSSWGFRPTCFQVTSHKTKEKKQIIRWGDNFDANIQTGNLLHKK